MWEDSKKPSFFFMEFLEKRNGEFEGKIVKKVDFVESHVLVHYSKIGNAIVYVDAVGFLHLISFKPKEK